MDTYKKPVDRDDVIEVTIESTGAKGDGIAKVNNFVVIVTGAKEGEKVKVKITRVLKKMAFAEIVSADTPASSGSSSQEGEESYEETEEQSYDEEN